MLLARTLEVSVEVRVHSRARNRFEMIRKVVETKSELLLDL